MLIMKAAVPAIIITSQTGLEKLENYLVIQSITM
jgi:hypothetical protein